MVSAGCALVSSQRGGWYRSGSIPPLMGLKRRTSWKDAGHWLGYLCKQEYLNWTVNRIYNS
jgi:hypothetical protein